MSRSEADRRPATTKPYAYISRTYGLDFGLGMRVTHTVTKRSGAVTRESPSQGHYVQVRFDGRKHASPCHPEELSIANGEHRMKDQPR